MKIQPNVGNYTSPMDGMGSNLLRISITIHGNPQPSLLVVITHILGVQNLPFLFFYGFGVQGIVLTYYPMIKVHGTVPKRLVNTWLI